MRPLSYESKLFEFDLPLDADGLDEQRDVWCHSRTEPLEHHQHTGEP